MNEDVYTFVEGGAGRIRLNRPKAIHALNTGMCERINEAIVQWRDNDAVKLLMIDHAEGRGFCAGGDVRAMASAETIDPARAFFLSEYQMNHGLFTYDKPTVSFMDGIVMGGGVGISQPCRYRIATENTRFAMPESTIGLFTDVGGGWYLSRLPGQIGKFLALSAARIDGADCYALGLATHYTPADRLDAVKENMMAEPEKVEAILSEASVEPPASKIIEQREFIDRLFAAERLEDILADLAADDSGWAKQQHTNLLGKSPLSCKVSLRLLREGIAMKDFADEMRQEFAVALRIAAQPDFREGVRALLIDKDNAPRWNPSQPEAVTEEAIAAIFAPLPADEAWTPLN